MSVYKRPEELSGNLQLYCERLCAPSRLVSMHSVAHRSKNNEKVVVGLRIKVMLWDPGFPLTFIFYVGGFSLNNATVSSKIDQRSAQD